MTEFLKDPEQGTSYQLDQLLKTTVGGFDAIVRRLKDKAPALALTEDPMSFKLLNNGERKGVSFTIPSETAGKRTISVAHCTVTDMPVHHAILGYERPGVRTVTRRLELHVGDERTSKSFSLKINHLREYISDPTLVTDGLVVTPSMTDSMDLVISEHGDASTGTSHVVNFYTGPEMQQLPPSEVLQAASEYTDLVCGSILDDLDNTACALDAPVVLTEEQRMARFLSAG